ncbi:hypothetical protein ACMFY5_26455, partial [Pseudomonas sihuiensis]
NDYRAALDNLRGRPVQPWSQAQTRHEGLCAQGQAVAELVEVIAEAVAISLLDDEFPRRFTEVDLRFTVCGLLGDHRRVQVGALVLAIDDYFARL